MTGHGRARVDRIFMSMNGTESRHAATERASVACRVQRGPTANAASAHAWPHASGVEHVDVVQLEAPIGGQNRHVFELRLSHQQPVERVAMPRGQFARPERVIVEIGSGVARVCRNRLST